MTKPRCLPLLGIFALLALMAMPLSLAAQQSWVDSTEYRRAFRDDRWLMGLVMDGPQNNKPLHTDQLGEWALHPLPRRAHPLLEARKVFVQWGEDGGRVEVDHLMRDGAPDFCATASYDSLVDAQGEKMALAMSDGIYQGVRNAMPYHGFWVSREGASITIRDGKVVAREEWPALRDFYFDYALRCLKVSSKSWSWSDAKLMAEAEASAELLLSSALHQFLAAHPIAMGTRESILMDCVAAIDKRGRIKFSALTQTESPLETNMIAQLNAWARTLPDFAISGFYTLDGRYLPCRLFMVHYSPDGHAVLRQMLTSTRRFESLR